MTWHAIDKRPAEPGTYVVWLFTGVLRRAHWSGKVWGDSHTAGTRKNANRSLVRALRAWTDDPATDAPALTDDRVACARDTRPDYA
jgi:hypothetical protein